MKNPTMVSKLTVNDTSYTIYSIKLLEAGGHSELARLPFSIRVLVENLLRHCDEIVVTWEDVMAIAGWQKKYEEPREIAYYPGRVIMQDFTGVPGIVDLAAMRDTMAELGKNPELINPLIPVDLVIDHSVQVDYFGGSSSLEKNLEMEYRRNGERYTLLKWAQKAFQNLRVFPPGAGIVHQVNLEYLARVVMTIQDKNKGHIAYPDSLVGTDSHTTMINGLGVLGWGVGGIEAEAVMLGQPYFMKIPEVVGVKLQGSLPTGTTATDLVLSITELLRKNNVVEKFVEFYGPGVKSLSVPDRATISNMSPEYGATVGFFPVDEKTIDYLEFTNRSEIAELVDTYSKEQRLFYEGHETPEYSQEIGFDLSTVQPCVAGPARPQDRIVLSSMVSEKKREPHSSDVSVKNKTAFTDEAGLNDVRQGTIREYRGETFEIDVEGTSATIGDGSVVIAAITSCTNTSNPSVLIGAGLLARNAVKRGLKVNPLVKTSFAPGSKVVVSYLEKSGLLDHLEQLGFYIVGYGCTTCIGNSGPLHSNIEKVIREQNLNVSAVLSGNRNFEARIHPAIRSNYLASPLLVVAFALAGTTNIDLTKDPISSDCEGQSVYLEDLWPSQQEIADTIKKSLTPEMFSEQYKNILEGDTFWKTLDVTKSVTFAWHKESTYIRKPPFFENFSMEPRQPKDIKDSRALVALGDSVTTDHISPAGSIPEHYPAGRHLMEKGVTPDKFNSYGSRRGNHDVMIRGTFANVRIKNKLVGQKEGGYTLILPDNRQVFIFDAAMHYRINEKQLCVLAGKEYGTGSSRDWAAKGTLLLGIKTVIAESFERIHRNNLVGMGVLPLQFQDGQSWTTLGLTGKETFTIQGLSDIGPGTELSVLAVKDNGDTTTFTVNSRLDTEIDFEYYIHGGILPYVLRKLAR